MPELIGREPELAVLEEFLDRDAPWPALLLTGGPGIGKTALWEHGLRLAGDRGIRVLAARPSGAEAELSFAGLFDLLEGIDIGSVAGLPVPQRRALEAALLLCGSVPTAPESPSSFHSSASRIQRRSPCRYSFANSSITGHEPAMHCWRGSTRTGGS